MKDLMLSEDRLATIDANLRKGIEAARKGREASDKAFDEMFPEKPKNNPPKRVSTSITSFRAGFQNLTVFEGSR
jgi:hypothetical protein